MTSSRQSPRAQGSRAGTPAPPREPVPAPVLAASAEAAVPPPAARARRQWPPLALWLLVLVPLVFNAVALWPEASRRVPSLNDDAVHYLAVRRASEALDDGENPTDHWLPGLELGFPLFFSYQHLPHLAVVLLHRLLLRHADLLLLFNLVRYLLMLAFPLVVLWSMRRMGFSAIASVVASAAAGLLSDNANYGFDYGSYLWRSHGMYTQLWAMPLSFVALACLERVVTRGTGYAAAVLACSAMAFTHLVYAYMMAITALVLVLVGLRRVNARARLARLAVVGGVAGIITAYMTLPFVLGKAYLSASAYLQRWKYDSFGAQDILRWLVDGDLLDFGRLPALTALLALGVATALFTRTRPARLALILFGVWLVLYFGRPTLGPVADLLPMHEGLLFHRFIGGVHVAAILLIGLAGDWLWRQLTVVPERWRAAALAGAVLVLLAPALRERHHYYALNTQWMDRAGRALDADGDAREILATLRALPPGRTYAGLPANWGGTELRFGDLHFYDLLLFNGIAGATRPYGGFSLNADIMWHFDERNPAHYDVLDVKYVVAPRRWAAPSFLRPIRETRRYVLYEAGTAGYGELVAIARSESPASQSALFARNRSWFGGLDPAARRFLRYDYPPRAGAAAAERAGCPLGKTSEEQVSAARIDLRTECATASALVIKVTYHPNWRVRVDGTEVPTFMASPSFIGVELPPGRHEVRAEYRSPAYRTALLIVGLLTLVAVIVWRRRLEQLDARLAAAGDTDRRRLATTSPPDG